MLFVEVASMPVLKINLDNETAEILRVRAQSERRPPDWQAEVLLRQSLGLPFPFPVSEASESKED